VSAAELRDQAASLAAEAAQSLALVAFDRDQVAKIAELLLKGAEAIEARGKSPFIKLGDSVTVHRNQVARFAWDQRHYMNGSAAYLNVTLVDGTVYRIEHRPWLLGGMDCSAIEKALTE
jgi:hypothetical protein